jgi:hypothetical protein
VEQVSQLLLPNPTVKRSKCSLQLFPPSRINSPPHLSSWFSSQRSFFPPVFPLSYPCLTVTCNMPGGPVALGGGIGANAPKSKLAGIFMVRPFRRAHFAPPLMPFFHFSRPLSPHSVASYLVMILVPSPAFSKCLTGFVPLVTPFPSPQPSLMATASHHLKGRS